MRTHYVSTCVVFNFCPGARILFRVLRNHVGQTERLLHVSRAGSRIAAKVNEVLKECHRRAAVIVRGDFVYPPGNEPIEIRDRSELDSAERKIELVPIEEIDRALLESVRMGYSMANEDAVPAVLSLLGFGRATQRIAGVVEERLEQLVTGKLLDRKDGMLSLAVKNELVAFE